MSWNTAQELVEILKSQSKTYEEIINILCETTDRYRGNAKRQLERVRELKKDLLDTKIETGLLEYVTVDEIISDYSTMSYTWYGYDRYWYNGQYWEKHEKQIPPDVWCRYTNKATRFQGKFKVLLEVPKKESFKGTVEGSVSGLTLVKLEGQSQMYATQRVKVTKL